MLFVSFGRDRTNYTRRYQLDMRAYYETRTYKERSRDAYKTRWSLKSVIAVAVVLINLKDWVVCRILSVPGDSTYILVTDLGSSL
jgi:hypothetical protein